MANPISATMSPREAAARDQHVRARRSWLRRFFDAFIEARQRQAEHEIARYLAGRGGKLTDSMEREIERRLGSNGDRPL